MLREFYKVIILLLFFITCNSNNKHVNKNLSKADIDSLINIFHSNGEYSFFIDSYMVPRDQNSNLFYYFNEKENLYIQFEWFDGKIRINNDFEDQVISYTKKKHLNNYEQIYKEIIENIEIKRKKMEYYNIFSYWGMFPDSQCKRLVISLKDGIDIYYHKNNYCYKEKKNDHLIYKDKNWIISRMK